jgi:hypothetical protein
LQIIPRRLLKKFFARVRVRRSLDIDGCCQRPRSVFAVGDEHSLRLNFMSKFNLSRLNRVSAFCSNSERLWLTQTPLNYRRHWFTQEEEQDFLLKMPCVV